jgi:hypothetical protein
MANNIDITPGSGATIGTKEVGGVHYQKILTYGVDNPAYDNIASAVTDTLLLAANAARVLATFFNDSTSVCYIKFSSGASPTSYSVKVLAGGYYELPLQVTGAIYGYWASANGNMRVTEIA